MPCARGWRAVAFVCAAVLVCGLATGPTATATSPTLRLRGGDVVLADSSSVQTAAAGAPDLARDAPGLFVVRFTGPITPADRAALTSRGVVIDGYLPDHAFMVSMTPTVAEAVVGLDRVLAVVRFAPEWKWSATARDAAGTGGAALYVLTVVEGGSAAGVRAAAEETGAVATGNGRMLLVAATSDQITALSGRDDITDIEAYSTMVPFNDREVFGTLKGKAALDRGYDGSTQIAAVADTGFGTGRAEDAHPHVPGSRIAAIHDWPTSDIPRCRIASPDGPQDVDSGHGTHTGVSIVGGGDSTGAGRAAAHKAKLVVQAVQDWAEPIATCLNRFSKGYLLGGLPMDLRDLFAQAYQDGARVHSNSWGGARNEYNEHATSIDDFVAKNRDMTILFAAGNAGGDKDKNGEVDPGSVTSPATAKNAISVGASESDRTEVPCDTRLTYPARESGEKRSWGQTATCASLNGKPPMPTWGDWFPSMAPVSPLKEDPQAGNDRQMAPFSGRGPTNDGRIKPEVVAPGSWVLSGYSPMFREGYGGTPNPRNRAFQGDAFGFPYSGELKYNTGTSMSTPIVAGAATVVRDYYQKRYQLSASAALVKATLVNSATDLPDENSDGRDDNRHPIPNPHEGWGLVNLDRATAARAAWVDEGTGLQTGATREFTVRAKAGEPMRITLAWSDPAAKAAAATALVNDLDLEVVGPDGTRLGNVFKDGWSATGGSADRLNNLENVYLATPASGTYTVRVKGGNIPLGPQTFALMMDGVEANGINRNPIVTNPGARRSAPGATVRLGITAKDTDQDPLTFTARGLPDGLTIARDGVITGSPTKEGRFAVTVEVTDGRDGLGWTRFAWEVEREGTNLVANPGFEDGKAGWSGDTSIIGVGVSPLAHRGTNLARFSDERKSTQQLSTTVRVPADAARPMAWFWVHIRTAEMPGGFARDTLTIDVNGKEVATRSNLAAGEDWQVVSVDMSAYRGQRVTMRWTTRQDSGLPTTFAIDDVTITPKAS